MARGKITPIKIVKDYAKNLSGKIKIDQVILFGSAARGRMNYHSDLDVIILSPNFKKMDFIKRLQLLSHARVRASREIPMDILGYTKEEFEELSKESVVLGEAKQKGKIIWP